jgi:hypothetical protein
VRRAAAAAIALLIVAACSGGSSHTATDSSSSSSASGSASVPSVSSSGGTTTTTAPRTTTTLPPPAQPTLPSDPAALAAQLVADEHIIRDLATSPDDLAAAARRAQRAYRLIGRHEEWDATILPAIPADLQGAVTKNIDARRRFISLAGDTPPSDTVPAWRIAAPAPADDLVRFYQEAQARFGVGWTYLAAINLVETGLGRIEGLSTAGAQGPMQFLPSTWDAYGAGGDIDDPHDSILGAARYLAANGFADGNVEGALYRYNNSHDYVAAVEDYAAAIADEPATFAAYHAWDVYYFTSAGDVVLPVGYEQPEPLPVTTYLATHPQ